MTRPGSFLMLARADSARSFAASSCSPSSSSTVRSLRRYKPDQVQRVLLSGRGTGFQPVSSLPRPERMSQYTALLGGEPSQSLLQQPDGLVLGVSRLCRLFPAAGWAALLFPLFHAP